jgi:hypothetical protein
MVMVWMQARPPGLSRLRSVAKKLSQYSRPTASNISMLAMASKGSSAMSR